MAYFYGRGHAMKTAAIHNFHIPLPEQLYIRLREAAKRQRRPATQMAKQAVEYWLEEQEKLVLHEEIASYAASAAGSIEDLDNQLESASLEHLDNTEHRQ
jgi:predicted DNA-binding protein